MASVLSLVLSALPHLFNPFERACYDPSEDKIKNCVKGSLQWWHERGHQEQYANLKKREFVVLSRCGLFYFMGMVVMSIIASERDIRPFLVACGMLFYFYPEVDAWIWVYRNHWKKVKP